MSDGTLAHVVLMKFHDRADAGHAAKLLAELVEVVPHIRTLTVDLDEFGTAVSYDLCLQTTHDSEAELVAYQQHSEHLRVAEWLVPRLADRAVVDFRL